MDLNCVGLLLHWFFPINACIVLNLRYALFFVTLCRELAHPQILVFRGVLEPTPWGCWGKTKFQKLCADFQLYGVSTPSPTPCCSKVNYILILQSKMTFKEMKSNATLLIRSIKMELLILKLILLPHKYDN